MSKAQIPTSAQDLLATKLTPPPARKRLVHRAHLLDRLDASPDYPLTLVCAPAGYGKSTLLSQWVSRRAERVCWYSLDQGDNDPAQFMRYLTAALQRVDPTVGALTPGMLQPPQPAPLKTVLISLINDLAASEKTFTLILDDYQVIEAGSVHEALNDLVESMPANVHLILATRADPPVNLPQLRARGQLLELRAADLTFTGAESESFFQEVMAVRLTPQQVEALVEKTEGWAAGLQIAALALQNRPDIDRAVRAFTGGHRHVLDYLTSQVIERLPGDVRKFLCQTAILGDLEASLCDAVTGRSDSRRILEQLERQNQFVIALDEDRRWYRYHRLMAQALDRYAEGLDADQLALLHQRASAWYREQGMTEAAIEHAFEAGDMDLAANLVERGAETVLKHSQVVTLLKWLDRLPEEWVRRRPRLSLAYAWALLLSGGSLQSVQSRLEDAVQGSADRMVSAETAVVKALTATLMGDGAQSLQYSRKALADLPEERNFLRSIAASNLGMAHVLLGEVESAIRAFNQSASLAQESGNTMFAVASLSNLGGLHVLKGQLKQAEVVYRQALELATTKQGRRLPVACRALFGLGEVAREWDDLGEAQALLEEGLALSQQYSEPSELMLHLSLARVLEERGQGEQALESAYKAQRIASLSTESKIDDRLVEAALGRLWIKQGNLARAAAWAAARGFEKLSPGSSLPWQEAPSLPYELQEAEWLQFARLQLAQGRAEASLETLEALLSEAQEKGRSRRLHEILVLKALACQDSGALDLAVESLEKSLKQAEPEGYLRLYISEGPPMMKLLQEAARRGIKRQYCYRLIGALQQHGTDMEHVSDGGGAVLIEPLSDRELQVLQLLAEGCTNREIGQRLYISLSTVKGHNAGIYGKLLVKNRTQAVARARELGILPGD